MKIIRIITVVIIILFISLSRKSIIPQRNEIDNMEILTLMGLDYNDEAPLEQKSSVSFIMEKEESNDSSSNENKKEYQQVMNYKSTSFNDALRQMQFYTDKTITGSHIKYFLIGEDSAKTDIDKALDELSKDQEVRLSSHIYLVKGSSAEEFFKNMVASDYKLGDILSSIENKNTHKTIIRYLTISELLSNKLSESGIYLIPTLKLKDTSDNITQIKNVGQEESEKLTKQLEILGYGIMKESKLVDYLDESESIIYNMLINKSEGGDLDIEDDKGDVISFNINDISSNYKFKFDKNTDLKEVEIYVKFRSNFEEVQGKENITITKNIKKYQKLQEEKVKKKVEKLIAKSQKLNLDILNIKQQLKLKHPYKFRKIKSTWEDSYNSLNITVKAESSIDRTYDIVRIRK